ncbi:MAG: hypothetical protein IKS18_00715 [Lachnospiraceae bacterium]|nr:hypothetical protein [Lachnospiraceae bacterium]
MAEYNSELEKDIFGDGSEEQKGETPIDFMNGIDPDEMKQDVPGKTSGPKKPNINIRLVTRDGEPVQILKADELYTKPGDGITSLLFKEDDRVLFSSETLFTPQEQAGLTRSGMEQIGEDVTKELGKLLKDEMDPDRITRRSMIDLSPQAKTDIVTGLKQDAIDRYLAQTAGRAETFHAAQRYNETIARNLLSALGGESHTAYYPANLLMASLDKDGKEKAEHIPVIQLSEVDSWTAEKVLGPAMRNNGMVYRYDRASSVFSAWKKTPDGREPVLNDFRMMLPPKHEEYDNFLREISKLRSEREVLEKAEQLKRANLNIRFTTRDGETLQVTRADDLILKTDGGVTTLAFKNDPERVLFSSKELFLPEETAALSRKEMESIGKAVAQSLGTMIEKELEPDRVTRRSVIDVSAHSDIDYVGSLKKAYIEKCLSLGGEARVQAYEKARENNEGLARNMFRILGIENVTKHYPASLLMTTNEIGKDGARGKTIVPVLQLSNVGQRTAAPVLGKVMQRYGLEWSYNKTTGVFSAWTRKPQRTRPILQDFRALIRPDIHEYDQMLFTMAKNRAEAEKTDRSYPLSHGYPRLSEDRIFAYAASMRSIQGIEPFVITDKAQNEVMAQAYLTGMGFARLTRRNFSLQIAEAKTIADLYKGEEEPYSIVVRMNGVSAPEADQMQKEFALKGLTSAYDPEHRLMSVSAYDGPDRPLFEGNLKEPDYERLSGEDFTKLAAHAIGIEDANRVIGDVTGTGYLAVQSESAYENIKEAEYQMTKYETEKGLDGKPLNRDLRAKLHVMRVTSKDRLLQADGFRELAARIRDERLLERGISAPPAFSRDTMEITK